MSDSGVDKRSFSRRDFIKLAGVAAVVGAEEIARRNLPFLRKTWDESSVMLTGKIKDLDMITSEIPESLEGKDIPIKNEWFRNADTILTEGMDLYRKWQGSDTKLSKLNYEPPPNYLSAPSMLHRLAKVVSESPDRLSDGVGGQIGYLLQAVDKEDVPYSMFYEGSKSGILSIQHMISIDPGSGLVKEIRQSMKDEYGEDFDVWSACRSGPLSDEQRRFFSNKFTTWYTKAMEFVQRVRDENTEPISTSVLFAYFLHNNDGDILASTWDTSTWLKIISRNDPKNDLKRDPSYEKAKLTCSLFRDEFSPTISANWVVENVDKNDELLNFVEDPYSYPEYKDYMPPNRAGGYYHAWNIMALCMSMSPFLAKRMVATQCDPTLGDSDNRSSEYGRDKSKADMLVADKADEISRIVNSYN